MPSDKPAKEDVDRMYYDFLRQSIEQEHRAASERRRRTVPLPDLRFEQSYLRLLSPYVRVERKTADESHDRKGKGKAVEAVEGEEVGTAAAAVPTTEEIHIRWGPVIWLTARDQLISPFVWGILGYFYWPIASSLRARIRGWWVRGASRTDAPKVDGHGVNWLRDWTSSLTKGGTHHVGFA